MAAWILGVSGGIGSGKTAATDHFQTLGIDVIDADIVAREIVQIGESALADIAEHFGQNVLQADGTLNRAVLREIVFADPAQRKALEAITHPAIRQRLQRLAAADDVISNEGSVAELQQRINDIHQTYLAWQP